MNKTSAEFLALLDFKLQPHQKRLLDALDKLPPGARFIQRPRGPASPKLIRRRGQ